MERKIKVFIDGQAGTTGLKLKDRLLGRDDVELLTIAEESRKDAEAKAEIMNGADAVFLCLPDAAARESVALIKNENTVIIDASTAHRTVEGWAYGFPELSEKHRKAVETSNRIAVPGCHASGFAALVYPLRAAGLISANYPLYAVGLTGFSGGGKSMIADYESGREELKAPLHYALSQEHKHLKEMQKVCGLISAPVFSPVVDDYLSGMTVSVPIFMRYLEKRATVEELKGLYEEHYRGARFVTVGELPEKVSPKINVGTNDMTLYVGGNDERAVVYATFDNLGKGASGAAVQCFNVRFGIREDKGL